MKSFQNFAVNIEEKRTTPGFGSPSGYDAQGEPMYTKRPGPKEPGRRATVQKSPKTVSQVKGEIEAAKRFAGVRSGGLETRNVPSFVTQRRQERASRLLGPNPWDMPGGAGAGQKTFERGLRKLTASTGPSKGHRERAFRDFVNQSADELGTSTDEIVASMIKGKSATPFTSPIPSTPDPWKPSETATKPPKPPRVDPTEPFGDSGPMDDPYRNQRTSSKPQAETKPKPKVETRPEPVRQKVSQPASKATVNVSSKPVGTKFAEPLKKQQLSINTEPAGPLVSNRPGESQTIRPQKGPGRTGILSKPRAGQMVGAKIEPVNVRVVTGTKPKITSSTNDFVKQTLQNLRQPQQYRGAGVGTKEIVKPPTPSKAPSTYRGLGVGTRDVTGTPSKVVSRTPSTYRGIGAGTVERVAKATPKSTASAAAQTQNLNQELKKAMRQQRAAADRLASQKFKAGGKLLGRTLGVAGAGLDIYQGYQGEKARGSGTTRSLAKGLTQAAGAAIGAGLGGGIVPVVGTVAGATAGSAVAGKLFDVAAGENAKERARRALERRQSQAGDYFIGKDATKITQKGKSAFASTGTGSDRRTAQLASKKVITDPITGKERVGYLAFKTSPSGEKQAVYKTGDTTQDLAKTSTNWLERLGRTYAPSLYKKSDEHKQRTELGNARAQQNIMRPLS